jgi:adenine deaminase
MGFSDFFLSGKLVDIHNREIYPAKIAFAKGRIASIERIGEAPEQFIMPGLIDAHIHIESSMVTPGAFALTAITHGTTSVVSDPHEIANVLGVAGVNFMINDSEKVPLKFFFGAPSCVPATAFETSGAEIDHVQIGKLLARKEILYLSEMMNFPGVIYGEDEVKLKLDTAKKFGKPVDGHAPGLRGEMLEKYVSAGISTDHECSSLEEAKEKILLGMKILIREGSAARNLDALKDLFRSDPGMVMLCSDDLHPEMLQVRHINKIVGKLINEGYDIFDVIRSATINPAQHYGLGAGLLRKGDPADMIVVDNLHDMNIRETWIDGVKVFDKGSVNFRYEPGKPVNRFNCTSISVNDLFVPNSGKKIKVIKAYEGELLTGCIETHPGDTGNITSDIRQDILKIVVKDRYNDAAPVIGFITGFGLKTGAFASSVAHDSHNIIAVGTNDNDIVNAVNEIIRMKGGLSVSSQGVTGSLQLDIAGIMSTRSCPEVANDYQALSERVKSFGCTMNAPFMTLSFMALLVIPELKIGDKGLFDVKKFQIVPLFTD